MSVRRRVSREIAAAAGGAILIAALVALLVTAPPAAAAPGDRLWVRTYPAGPYVEEFRDLVAGPKHSVYAVGVAQGTEETGKLLVARYGDDGARLWTRTYGAGGDGATGYRAVAVPGGVIVTGTAGNVSCPHKGDILVARYSATGRRLWTVRYDGTGHRNDSPACVATGLYSVTGKLITVYVGGTSVGRGTGSDYVVLQVHASSGRVIWTRRYDGPGTADEMRAVHADADGNVYVTGVSADSGDSTAAATLGYDLGGRRLWLRRLHADGNPTSGVGITIGMDDADAAAVYVAGTTVGGAPTAGKEVMLAQLDIRSGAERWTRTAGVPDADDTARAFADDPVYGYAIAGGTVDSATHAQNGFVATWDQFGTFTWQKTFTMGLPTDQAAFGCVAYGRVGATCGGCSAAQGTGEDFTVAGFGVDGDLSWTDVYDGAAHGGDVCRDVLVRGTGIFAAGSVSKGGVNTSGLLIKYAR